jgi:uncharacterized protein YjbI with pentapeptide repeats
LFGADLSDADLTNANLGSASLERASLLGANLQDTKVDNVIYCKTVMPDGTLDNSGCGDK